VSFFASMIETLAPSFPHIPRWMGARMDLKVEMNGLGELAMLTCFRTKSLNFSGAMSAGRNGLTSESANRPAVYRFGVLMPCESAFDHL
jgi:hypothetical protein